MMEKLDFCDKKLSFYLHVSCVRMFYEDESCYFAC